MIGNNPVFKYALLLLLALGAFPGLLDAGVPLKMNFQGRLNESGEPAEGAKTFIFKIYDALSDGSLVWTSQAQAVAVSQGIFSVVLENGESVNLSTSVFSGARYVELTVNGVPLAPRQEMVSAPYAMIAQGLAPDAEIPSSSIGAGAVNDSQVLLSTAAITSGKFGDERVQISTASVSGLGALAFGGAEADPLFTAHVSSLVVTGDITNWNIAFSWGDHASGGYASAATLSNVIASTAPLANAADWNTAYGWGNHASAAYAELSSTQVFSGANTFAGSATFSSTAAFTAQSASVPGLTVSSGLVVAAGNVGIGTAAPNSRLHIAGAISLPIKSVTASYALTAEDGTVLVDASGASADLEIFLPDAAAAGGRLYFIKRTDDPFYGYAVNVVPQAGQTLELDYNNGSPLSMNNLQGETVIVQSDGVNWILLSWYYQ